MQREWGDLDGLRTQLRRQRQCEGRHRGDEDGESKEAKGGCAGHQATFNMAARAWSGQNTKTEDPNCDKISDMQQQYPVPLHPLSL